MGLLNLILTMNKLLFKTQIFTLLFVFSLFTGWTQVLTMEQNSETQTRVKPRVTILATGGTIAGSGKSATRAGYTAGQLPVEDLLNAVPQIHEVAQISGEQISNIGSQDMTVEIWLKLSKRINEIFENDEADAVVITHGTDTMEETAYFLSLTIQYEKPVVLVGAMRASTAMSQDGNRNLLDAVIVASAPESRDAGVVIAMNEFIIDARDADKVSTTNTAAFQSENFGPLGIVHDGKVSYYYKSLRKPEKKFDVRNHRELPKIDIIYGYAGAGTDFIDTTLKNGTKGIIYAGVGNGNFSTEVQNALASAVKNGMLVCRSSRIPSGKVTLFNEVDDEALGFVVSDDLSPQKARILLMLALTQTKDKKEIQQMFLTY